MPLAVDTDALDAQGHVVLPRLLKAAECRALVAGYADATRFRSHIVMARYNFGRGEYQYFNYPLPPTVQALRETLYAALAPTANAWMARMRKPARYPKTLQAYLVHCHRPGQKRPTPLMLKYGRDDYNCLHQDLYGEAVFPLQVTVLLSQPEDDFTGGEAHPDRAAPAHAVARNRHRAETRRRCRICRQRTPGRGHARRLSREDAPRREYRHARRALRTRPDLPRRRLNLGQRSA